MKEKIKFGDLNGLLKTVVVIIILMGIWGISFILGFFCGLLGII